MMHPDDLIRRYLDGELRPIDASDLRAHLATCDRCARQISALERLDARLRDLNRLAPEPGFAARVRAEVVALPPPGRAARRQWALACTLALGGLLSILLALDQFYALAANLLAAAVDLAGLFFEWPVALAAPGAVSQGVFGADEPALVAGLCMLGVAGLLILRRSLESPVEA